MKLSNQFTSTGKQIIKRFNIRGLVFTSIYISQHIYKLNFFYRLIHIYIERGGGGGEQINVLEKNTTLPHRIDLVLLACSPSPLEKLNSD